jgi:ankyrin repeat protein
VESGADVHACGDGALRWASESGDLEVVKYLVEKGANVHADNDWALRWASCNGHLDVVRFLIESGADVHAALLVIWKSWNIWKAKELEKNR